MKRLILAFVLVALPAFACNADCVEPPPLVEAYIKTLPGWSLVKVDDLPDDDKVLWKQNHVGEMPGLAVVNLDGNKNSYILALHKKVGDSWLEQVVLLTKDKKSYSKIVIVEPNKIVSPFVVWRVGPGSYLDRETGKKVTISNDSFVFEKIESSSTQFYMKRGVIKSLIASD